MKKALVKTLLSRKGLDMLKRGILKRELKKLIRAKKLRSKEASEILFKLSRQLMKEKKRVRRFVKREIKREVKKAKPHVMKLIEVGIDCVTETVNRLLRSGKLKKSYQKIKMYQKQRRKSRR